MRAIVLAGGLGTRLRSVVSDLPKPMASVAGRPFLERLLDYWIAQGASKLVLSVGYLHDKVQDHFGDRYRGVPITWSVESTPLGTGGGLAAAWRATARDEAVLVLNGDTFFEARLGALEKMLRDRRADGVMAVFEAPLERRYAAIATDAAGRITGVGETASGRPGLMNGGTYLFAPSFFDSAPGGDAFSLESDWFPAALARGQVLYACRSGGRFIDIGVPADYARAAEVFADPS